MTFSSAVSDGSRWKHWNTNPTCLARTAARPSSSRRVRSEPLSQVWPELGSSRPASRASRVDLPAPDAPMMATVSPAATSKLTPSRMVSVPSGLLTCLLKASVLRTMEGAVAAVTETLFADAFMIDSIFRRWALVALALLASAAQAGAPAPAASPATPTPTILVFGDSLSAAYGISQSKGWVALLAKRLEAQGYGYQVVNASASGETTGGGRTRWPRALDLHKPAIAILELGSNDGLRGLPIEQMRANLDTMIQLAKSRGARVLLLGMQMPPNYGPAYTTGFRSAFTELAKSHQVSLVPFFMEGVALNAELMQDDDLHPNEAGQPLLLDNVWPFLEPLLKRNVNVQQGAKG